MAERPKFKHGFTMPLDSPERRRLNLGITETSDSYSEGETISKRDIFPSMIHLVQNLRKTPARMKIQSLRSATWNKKSLDLVPQRALKKTQLKAV